MPVSLDRDVLDRGTDASPLHQQIADYLSSAIAAGRLAPNELLLSESNMAANLGVNRRTVGQALSSLALEGLIIPRAGARARVAPPPTLIPMDTSRYRKQLSDLRAGIRPTTTALVEQHGAVWTDYTVDCTFTREQATVGDVQHLRVPTGTLILRRESVCKIRGKPVQIHRSALPYAVAKGTPLARRSQQPYRGGILAEMFDAGLIPTRVTEAAQSRVPSRDERDNLGMSGGQVWSIVRVFWINERPIEASRLIMPTIGNVLSYETDLRDVD